MLNFLKHPSNDSPLWNPLLDYIMEPIITWQHIIIIITIIIVIIIIVMVVFILVKLVVDFSIFCGEQVTPSNLRSKVLAFSKQCYFLQKPYATFYTSPFFSSFCVILRAPIMTGAITFFDKFYIFFVFCLDHYNCLPFPVFSAQLLCPQTQ